MSQSLAKIYVHIVFSTKQREALIDEEIGSELYKYLNTVLLAIGSSAVNIGGMPDHVHVLTQLSKTHSLSDHIEEIKKRTSKWIKTKGVQYEGFAWQAGYGAFSVSQSQVPVVTEYIRNQKKHHQKLSFQDELRQFLDKYQVDYDEKYLWD